MLRHVKWPVDGYPNPALLKRLSFIAKTLRTQFAHLRTDRKQLIRC